MFAIPALDLRISFNYNPDTVRINLDLILYIRTLKSLYKITAIEVPSPFLSEEPFHYFIL
jgi:hypothetical protein